MTRSIIPRPSAALIAGIFALLATPIIANAQERVEIPQASVAYEENPKVSLPLVICWYNGKKNFYIQTDASDRTIAAQQGVNYVPQLANAIDAPGGAVDDIYVFSNSNFSDQYNVLPSEPTPVGPHNRNASYSPLWRVSSVTWKEGVPQVTLKSEKEILDAEANGWLTVVKTRIVLNCPVLYDDAGGLLPKAVIRLSDGDGDDRTYRNN